MDKQALAICMLLSACGDDDVARPDAAEADAALAVCAGVDGWTWRMAAATPTLRANGGAAEAGGRIYYVGGRDAAGAVARVDRFDPVTSRWEEIAPLPAARCCLAVARAGGRIYALGGYDASGTIVVADVFSLDPDAGTWRTESPMPTARANAAAFELGGRLWVVGGRPTGASVAVTDVVEVLDPATGAWEAGPTRLPAAREAMRAVAADSGVYLVGGATDAIETAYGMTVVQRWAPAVGSWIDEPDLGVPRVQAGGGLALGCVIAAGGWTPSAHSASAEVLGPAGAWAPLPDMPTPRAGPASAVVGDELYVIGGWQLGSGSEPVLLDAVEVLGRSAP